MKRFLTITLTVLMLATLIGCGQKEITDGSYTVDVTLSGGSGRASVESPCKVMIADGQATATIIWSSPFYEYMPIAMSEPHLVDYILRFDSKTLKGE